MNKTRFTNYYSQCDEYKNKLLPLLPNLQKHIDFWKMDLPSGYSWNDFVRRGLAFINYRFCSTSFEALIWGGEYDLLKVLLEAVQNSSEGLGNKWVWAYEYLVENDAVKSRESFAETAKSYPELELCGKIIFDNCRDKISNLKTFENNNGDTCTRIVRSAEEYNYVHNDETKARHLLITAETEQLSVYDLIYLAEAWKLMLNENTKANKLLAIAANKSGMDSQALRYVEKSRRKLFGEWGRELI